MHSSRSLFTLATAVALTFAACGGGHSDNGTAATVAADAAFNKADATFAQGMIPHHEQAIEMSEIALDPATGASAAVTALATAIKAAQDPEIQQMKALLTSWDQPIEMDTSDGHKMEEMEGMMSADAMQKLDAATGTAFDAQWAEMMIEHHRGAITMAETVKKDGKHPEIQALAAAIIAGQSAEIKVLEPIAG